VQCCDKWAPVGISSLKNESEEKDIDRQKRKDSRNQLIKKGNIT
jgi:hypothetical protein